MSDFKKIDFEDKTNINEQEVHNEEVWAEDVNQIKKKTNAIIKAANDGAFDPTFKSTFKTTIDRPGIPKGTDVTVGDNIGEFIKNWIAPYVGSTINSLTLDYSVNDPLVGQPVTVTDAVFSFGNDSDGNKPKNIAIEWNGQTDVVLGTDVNKAYVDENDDEITSFSLTRNTAGDLTFATLTAQDAEDNDLVRTTTKTFKNEFLFGTSSVDVTTQAEATTLFGTMSKTKSNSKNQNISGNAQTSSTDNFTYWAIADELGSHTTIELGAENVSSALVFVGGFTYNNGYIDTTVKLYRLTTTAGILTGQTYKLS